MKNFSALYQILFWLTISLAIAALAYSVFFLPVDAFGLQLLIFAFATVVFGIFALIRIPRFGLQVNTSHVLAVAALFFYGGEVATILAVLSSVAGSFSPKRNEISRTVNDTALNAGIAGISMFASVVAISAFKLPTVGAGADLPRLAISLAVVAGVHFLISWLIVTVYSKSATDEKFSLIGARQALTSLILCVFSCSMAFAGISAFYHLNNLGFIVVATIGIVLAFTFSSYTPRSDENDKEKVSEAEQRAELAEQHIEQLQQHITQQQVTEKALRDSKEKFKHAAYHDTLTNLPNRNLFTRQLQFLLKRCQQTENSEFAVLFLDLNRFKTINDSLGHSTGDNLILGVAKRLSKLMRQKDMVARLSGDEFAIILYGMSEAEEVKHFAQLIKKKLSAPFTLDERTVFTSVSIGIAIADPSYETAEDLLRDADIAMYQAKAQEKTFVVFDKKMHARAVTLLQVETDLRYALERNEMVAYYQPIIDLQNMKVIGFESLMRWNHPTRGLVPPGEFIPVSEDTGLIVPLTMWMLRDSCKKLASWKSKFPGTQEMMISVNLSGKHFAQDDLVASVKEVLKETGIEPRYLKLELTESAVMENAEVAISILQQLKRVGVKISIDDFGTGYSSLSYLHRFPIDTLKIDRSFVSRMEAGTENGEIVRTVVALAKALGLTVIAEGIETIHQLHQLRILGSEYGQGFLFSRPVPLAETEALLKDPDRWKNIMSEQASPVVHPKQDTILQLGDL